MLSLPEVITMKRVCWTLDLQTSTFIHTCSTRTKGQSYMQHAGSHQISNSQKSKHKTPHEQITKCNCITAILLC